MKLTTGERIGLTKSINLADAHTHQSPDDQQLSAIISDLEQIYRHAQSSPLLELEHHCYSQLMTVGRQWSAIQHSPLACYSASMATEVVANLLRSRRSRVMLVEPCFDNIPDILRRHDISLTPISDDTYCEPDAVISALQRERPDYLFLVSPNNPTGSHVAEDALSTIAEYCAGSGIGLIMDLCFRLYEPAACEYDQYSVLDQAGVEYIAIEDSGKVWPTLDQKVSFIVASRDLAKTLEVIHDDFLLNVSPFTLEIVAAFARLSQKCACEDFRRLIRDNRKLLRDWLAAYSYMQPAYVTSNVSVEVVRGTKNAKRIVTDAADRGLALLSCEGFYWNTRQRGSDAIRIALARDTSYLAEGLVILGGVL